MEALASERNAYGARRDDVGRHEVDEEKLGYGEMVGDAVGRLTREGASGQIGGRRSAGRCRTKGGIRFFLSRKF